ncbi:MAG: DUF1295 domain-containing protein [Promethearchaeota archaeon]
MEEIFYFNCLMILILIPAIIIFFSLFKVTAGYGQHFMKTSGKTINDKTGWVLMESPAIILYIILYIIGKYHFYPVIILFSTLFLMHYSYRTFIFPKLMRGNNPMPLSIVISGMIFNSINVFLQGRWINTLSGGYETSWLLNPAFIIGIILFFHGFIIHLVSDRIIRKLRKPGETCFKIPYGGMFEYVSCPSYLGEITEWFGWAIMTWSLPGLIFAIWTFANLTPRARSNHIWYLKTFSDYPKKRKALIPYIF